MSSLRRLVAGVARAVLLLRPCKRCQRPFLHCRSRQPGRLYCLDCSRPAQKERERKAREKYRSKDYGQAQHRDEEAERRERLRLGRVGDRRCGEEPGRLEVPAVPEVADASPREKKTQAVEWVLVAWPGLLSAATRLRGALLACPCCGRAGRVVQVLGLDVWQRRRRRGLG